MPDEIKLGKRKLLSLLWGQRDGVRPEYLVEEFGITRLSAAAILSRYKKQGIILKRKCEDGKCRYILSSKGERKLAYLDSLEGKA